MAEDDKIRKDEQDLFQLSEEPIRNEEDDAGFMNIGPDDEPEYFSADQGVQPGGPEGPEGDMRDVADVGDLVRVSLDSRELQMSGESLSSAESPPKKKAKKRLAIKVDDKTILSKEVMQKHFKDTAPLLREFKRAKKKPKFMQEEEIPNLFFLPSTTLPQHFANIFKNNMSLPTVEKPSVESIDDLRQGEAEEPEVGGVDFGFHEDSEILPGGEIGKEEEPLQLGTPGDVDFEPAEQEISFIGESTSDEKGMSFKSQKTKRTLLYLGDKFSSSPQISLHEEISGKSRNITAGFFYELLVISSRNFIDVKQEKPYDDILITKTKHFEEAIQANQVLQNLFLT